GPAGEIDDDPRQRFVERDVGVAEAADAALVAEGLGERFADDEADVFDRVVIVDVRVAGGDHVEIGAGVAGDGVEHVREEADRRLDARCARAVETDGDGDARLFRGPRDRCGTVHMASCSASRNRSFCSGVPTETRSASAYSRISTPRAQSSSKTRFGSRTRKKMKFAALGN